MATPTKPNDALALKSLPPPLRKALHHIFASQIRQCWLVGGTALAGFYSCHRESDDLDLFTGSATAQAAAVAAVNSLASIGATFTDEHKTPTYYHALAVLDQHRFTVDVVLDTNIHRVGAASTTDSGITVADLETLLRMKIATLVSRCSEKDLYDLVWLTRYHRFPDTEEWLTLGQEIDAGATAEAVLISLVGSAQRQAACEFAEKFGVPSDEVLKSINALKENLQNGLVDHLEKSSPDPSLLALVRKIKKFRR